MFRQYVEANRSYRRFDEGFYIPEETLIELIDLTRFVPSAMNWQPLRYIMSNEKEKNDKIFPTVSWAGYIKDWGGPKEGERPSAYIVIVGDKKFDKFLSIDAGIAAQTILLGAVEKGLGGCMLGSVRRDELRKSLAIPDEYEIVVVLALGRPREKVVIEELGPSGNIEYWRDREDTHHVPKRPLKDIILPV